MIEVKELCKNFGKVKALEKVSINVKRGSVYGLVGSNGAGKTTLIKHLAGVYKQDNGTVTINNQQVYENPKIKALIFYIPDEIYFFSQYSIEETAHFYAGFYPTWNWERYQLLKRVFSIDPSRKIIRLSRGMQKQVAFWLGISAMPQIMLLDEPVDGLDPVMRKQVWNILLQDVAERETTVLLSSHNLRELEDVCDHVGLLHQGNILAERALDELKTDIHKIQVAFAGTAPSDLLQKEIILHQEQSGSIFHLIVKGNKEQIIAELQQAKPILLDILPLTLEEIFIYELGGIGYDIQKILI